MEFSAVLVLWGAAEEAVLIFFFLLWRVLLTSLSRRSCVGGERSVSDVTGLLLGL